MKVVRKPASLIYGDPGKVQTIEILGRGQNVICVHGVNGVDRVPNVGGAPAGQARPVALLDNPVDELDAEGKAGDLPSEARATLEGNPASHARRPSTLDDTGGHRAGRVGWPQPETAYSKEPAASVWIRRPNPCGSSSARGAVAARRRMLARHSRLSAMDENHVVKKMRFKGINRSVQPSVLISRCRRHRFGACIDVQLCQRNRHLLAESPTRARYDTDFPVQSK